MPFSNKLIFGLSSIQSCTSVLEKLFMISLSFLKFHGKTFETVGLPMTYLDPFPFFHSI